MDEVQAQLLLLALELAWESELRLTLEAESELLPLLVAPMESERLL